MDLGLEKKNGRKSHFSFLNNNACTDFLRITPFVQSLQLKTITTTATFDKSSSGVHPVLELGIHSLSVVSALAVL